MSAIVVIKDYQKEEKGGNRERGEEEMKEEKEESREEELSLYNLIKQKLTLEGLEREMRVCNMLVEKKGYV